jgi:ribonuclease HI
VGDELKNNIDGSSFCNNRTGVWGFIVHNYNSEFMGAGVGFTPQPYAVLQTEALAYMFSLNWAHDWGMTKVQVETDSQLLHQDVLGNSQDLPINGQLLDYFFCKTKL